MPLCNDHSFKSLRSLKHRVMSSRREGVLLSTSLGGGGWLVVVFVPW